MVIGGTRPLAGKATSVTTIVSMRNSAIAVAILFIDNFPSP
jgi:hypothetical protein